MIKSIMTLKNRYSPRYFICFISLQFFIVLKRPNDFSVFVEAALVAAFSSQNKIHNYCRQHLFSKALSTTRHWESQLPVENVLVSKSPIWKRQTSSISSLPQEQSGTYYEDDGVKRISTIDTDIRVPQNGHTDIISRRRLFHSTAAATAVLSTAAVVAEASSSELDKKSGEMFVPKKSMLGGGGSDETRGVPLRDRTEGVDSGNTRTSRRQVLSRTSGESIQTVYETRFIAYLTRFLFNFDPSAKAWWDNSDQTDVRFAEFAESVEVGLADYFCGPYGSYASVSAAKAGLTARIPAVSSSYDERKNNKSGDIPSNTWVPNFIETLFMERNTKYKDMTSSTSKLTQPPPRQLRNEEKQGVLNLLTLLQARYKSIEAKRQLALLFSMITDPALQPSEQIASLLGEADNASIGSIELSTDTTLVGYTNEPLQVTIDPPPALGSDYKVAQASALLRPTSRVLRIRVLDGGEGYKKAPRITVLPASGNRAREECQAVATVDREGRVDSIIVLDPGFGYSLIGSKKCPVAPRVFISHPVQSWQSKQDTPPRAATAITDLEYEVYGVNVTEPGNGYVLTQPPRVTIPPPTSETDWSIQSSFDIPNAKVTQMVSTLHPKPNSFNAIDMEIIELIQKDLTALLPSDIRPTLISSSTGFGREKKSLYCIPGLTPPPSASDQKQLPSPLYAAFDPIFGAVGIAPVTKGAILLSADQYTRLAVSGAICTVIVRCLLNPLEVIKTKIQLENDEELMSHARRMTTNITSLQPSAPPKATKTLSPPENLTEDRGADNSGGLLVLQSATSATELEEATAIGEVTTNLKLSTVTVAKSLIALRGLFSLFQSADITLLVSLVLGGLGFGATELFRRAFTSFFFENGATAMESQLTLLGAAALATIVTSLAATPFELTRVRSMGQVESKGWRDVLSEILMSERMRRREMHKSSSVGSPMLPSISLTDLTRSDVEVLFAPFPKIISRELPFAIAKFLTFDIVAKYLEGTVNAGLNMQVQVGVGPKGLAISAFAGAVAGVAGAVVSHPADLILTLSSSASKKSSGMQQERDSVTDVSDWKDIMKDLIRKEGGISNLFTGLLPRAFFFFLVIGSQFFLYDYIKNLLSVGYDDLSLVLDVFYAVRRGLLDD